MIHLHFKVEPVYLVYHTLVSTHPLNFIDGQKKDQIISFQNEAWLKDKEAYQFLQHGVTDAFFVQHKSLAQLATRAEKLLQDMIAEPSFSQIQEQTLQALSQVRDEWEVNLAKTFAIMSDNTGLVLDKEVDVYITHPSQTNGLNSGGDIFWTYRNDFPNYNTVYLWHEVMHGFLVASENTAECSVEHAIIELLTDNELRVRLNGGTYPPLIGHPELLALKEQLLDKWRSYLSSSSKDINNFVTKAKKECKC